MDTLCMITAFLTGVTKKNKTGANRFYYNNTNLDDFIIKFQVHSS